MYLYCSDRLSVQECLSHPWLNTEELFQRSPVRKSRRSYGSEQKQKRKKLKKMQHQNGLVDGELVFSIFLPAFFSWSKFLCHWLFKAIISRNIKTNWRAAWNWPRVAPNKLLQYLLIILPSYLVCYSILSLWVLIYAACSNLSFCDRSKYFDPFNQMYGLFN